MEDPSRNEEEQALLLGECQNFGNSEGEETAAETTEDTGSEA